MHQRSADMRWLRWLTLSAALITAVLHAPLNRPVTLSPVITQFSGPVRASTIDTERLPLTFEPNVGQADGRVKFLARGDGYTLWLTTTEAVLQLRAATTPRVLRQV